MKTNFTSQMNRAAWAIRKAAAQAMNVRVSDVSWKVCLDMARNNETFLAEVKMEKPVFRTWHEIHDEDIENSHGDTVAQKEFEMHGSTEHKDFWIAELTPVSGGKKGDELNGFKRNFLKRKQIHAYRVLYAEEGSLYEAKILDDRFFFFLDHEGEIVRVERKEIPQILLKLNPKLVKIWENATFN